MVDTFTLEPSEHGVVPERVIEELVKARTVAKDHAQAYSDVVTAQAEKYGVKAGALKRFINALQSDALDTLTEETNDLERLMQ